MVSTFLHGGWWYSCSLWAECDLQEFSAALSTGKMGWQYSSWWWEGNNFIQVYWKKWKEKKRLLFTYIHIQWAKTNCTAGSTPLDGEREATSFKFIGRSERKRKDFCLPIHIQWAKTNCTAGSTLRGSNFIQVCWKNWEEKKRLVCLAVLLLMVRGKQLHSSFWEKKTKDFCCFPLRVLPAVQLVLAHSMCIEQKRTQEPLAYVGSVRTLVGALLCTWGYLCLP